MDRMIETEESIKKALLVMVAEEKESERRRALRREELASLVDTLALEPIGNLYFFIREPNAATLLGKGMLEEIRDCIRFFEVDLVVFDTSLSPRVLRNLERELDICCIDREEVILQIFADRASTREAVLQVSLARAEYSLPRLSRRWESLSQQRGGVRGAKGAGEKQLELDKRKLEKEIISLKRQLEDVKKRRETQRKGRRESSVYSFAIVGYTNAGKSTLLNTLTKSDALAEDKLFATLDTTTRRLVLDNHIKSVISDTVGFVSNLPHHLVKAFSSTLEEAALADCLILVINASSVDAEKEYETTLSVLNDLGCQDKERIIIFNKCDLEGDELTLARLKISIPDAISVSAKQGIGLDRLRILMAEKARSSMQENTVELSAEDGKGIADIYRKYNVLSAAYKEDKVIIKYTSF